MALYSELMTAANHGPLRDKIRVAIVIAAEVIRTEDGGTPNNANRLLWAKTAFMGGEAEMHRMLWAVLAQNKDATYAQIIGADDATVQTAVNAAVNVFAIGV